MKQSDTQQRPQSSPHGSRVRRDPPRKRPRGPSPVLLAVLAVCVAAVLIFLLTRLGGRNNTQAADPAVPFTPPVMTGADAAPSASPADTAAPEPSPEATPEAAPAPTESAVPAVGVPLTDFSQAVPAGTVMGMDWFSDAVFIGDSRTEGLKLYSGITGADFLDYTGVTVYDIVDGKKVIGTGSGKVSVLDALTGKQYQKIYVALGVNELGYYDPDGFAATYGSLIDKIRELEPDATVYVQSIIPVNEAKCKANSIPSYITNDGVASYNAALAQMAAEKQVPFVNVSEAMVDATGTVPRENTGDGVHFKKEGYVKWLNYLLNHTGA